MYYVLTVILFNGVASYSVYDTALECNRALYRQMDEIFIKNIDMIECTEED